MKTKKIKEKVSIKLKDFCHDNAGLAYTVSDAIKSKYIDFRTNSFLQSHLLASSCRGSYDLGSREYLGDLTRNTTIDLQLKMTHSLASFSMQKR